MATHPNCDFWPRELDMKPSRRYLPLSTAILLIATTGSAFAGSALDPYAHIAGPKQETKKQKDEDDAPVIDKVSKPTTYVTSPMGDLSEGKQLSPKHVKNGGNKDDGGGIMGAVLSPFNSASKTFKSGAKASGGAFKVLGKGFKSTTGAIVDGTQSVGNKVASSVPKRGQSSAGKSSAGVEDMYMDRATKTIEGLADADSVKKIVNQDPKKAKPGTKTAFLPPAKRGWKSKVPNPLGSMKKLTPPLLSRKSKNNDPVTPSGFYEGAEEAQIAKNHPEQAAPLPTQDKKQKKTTLASSNGSPEDKKSRFGISLSNPLKNVSLKKPSMPGFLGGKSSVASKPKEKKEKESKEDSKWEKIVSTPADDLQRKMDQVANRPQQTQQPQHDPKVPGTPNKVAAATAKEVKPTVVQPKEVQPHTAKIKEAKGKPVVAKGADDDSKLSSVTSAVGKSFSKLNFLKHDKDDHAKDKVKTASKTKSHWEDL